MPGEKKTIIITPETHWDREWYLPFQEYRAKLVQLLDSLLEIYRKDDSFANFTLDGQTVPLEDYLEVRPSMEDELKKRIQEGRLSIGPLYVLPDEFLVSGESMIRNFLLGARVARRFGVEPMKAGYIPDPFGHFAQMPQILAGFGIPSIIFARGFDDSFEKLGLDMEFTWEAPGNAARVLGIHLLHHYGNAARMPTTRDPKTGIFKAAMEKIKYECETLGPASISDVILLNNGSDHLFPQPEIPEIVRQWNDLYGEEIGIMEQADHARYTSLILERLREKGIEPKVYRGELHGGRYNYLLSGVFSARMWIKQWNRLCEHHFTRYSEPMSTIAWILDPSIPDDRDFLWTGWRWLLRNHPHDSICGCSIDEVHDVDMKARFNWAQQISTEVFKNSIIRVMEKVHVDTRDDERFPILVFNPLPRRNSGLVIVDVLAEHEFLEYFPPGSYAIQDEAGNPVPVTTSETDVEDRYRRVNQEAFSLRFIADNVPAMGFKLYYLVPGEEIEFKPDDMDDRVIDGENDGRPFIENKYYKVVVNHDGSFDVLDKETGALYRRQGILEDVGDWGDEYDFSGPNDGQEDTTILSTATPPEILVINDGIEAKISLYYEMLVPESLADDRSRRSENRVLNPVEVVVGLTSVEKLVSIDIAVENNAMDHRLRMLFSSGIKTDTIHADGHFYVVPRPVDLPDGEGWSQPPVPTKHQNDFVAVSDEQNCFAVLNHGLPEYAPVRMDDGTVDIAITLLRSVGWLSRGDLATRSGNAGPALSTPGAQCLGEWKFHLGIFSGKGGWLEAGVHLAADAFTNFLQPAIPSSLASSMRQLDICEMPISYPTSDGPAERPIIGEFSTLELEGDAFLLTAFKRAENDEQSAIIRLVNMAPTKERCTIKLGRPILSARLVTLAETTNGVDKVRADIIESGNDHVALLADGHVIVTLMVEFQHRA